MPWFDIYAAYLDALAVCVCLSVCVYKCIDPKYSQPTVGHLGLEPCRINIRGILRKELDKEHILHSLDHISSSSTLLLRWYLVLAHYEPRLQGNPQS